MLKSTLGTESRRARGAIFVPMYPGPLAKSVRDRHHHLCMQVLWPSGGEVEQWWVNVGNCRSMVQCPRMSVDMLGTNCDQCRSMVQCCFTSTETLRFVRTESPGRPPRLSHSS